MCCVKITESQRNMLCVGWGGGAERGNGRKKRPRVPPTVENDTDEPVKEF